MLATARAKFYLRSLTALLALSGAASTRMPAAEAADLSVDPNLTPVNAQMGNAVNAVRGEMNLPALKLDTRLCAAAGGHAAYMTLNHVVTHKESANLPGYTAATATDRAGAHGYSGGCYETVIQGTAGIAAVRRLFDAPYHRQPFLQPGTFEIGTGAQSDIVTLMFGMTSSDGVVTYPYDGQKNVPTSWDGNEMPNPLRVHPGAAGKTGYAITLFRFSQSDLKLKVASATLSTADGKPVAAYLNTPDNDDFLDNGALLLPQQPLHPGTTYRVAIQATDSNGADCSRTWTFTTAYAAAPLTPHYAPASRNYSQLASLKH